VAADFRRSGSAECAWAVARVLEKLRESATESGIETRVVEFEPGPEGGTLSSALIALKGPEAEVFAASWRGTVQWIGPSPFRPTHKRRNWFVAVERITEAGETEFNARDVRFETMRASGPGGQHVNRTESAVRVTHSPSGLQAVASEERSQFRNRKLALARLAQKIREQDERRTKEGKEKRWLAHREVERGNPVRIFREAD
jgi:peptide chain release factor